MWRWAIVVVTGAVLAERLLKQEVAFADEDEW